LVSQGCPLCANKPCEDVAQHGADHVAFAEQYFVCQLERYDQVRRMLRAACPHPECKEGECQAFELHAKNRHDLANTAARQTTAPPYHPRGEAQDVTNDDEMAGLAAWPTPQAQLTALFSRLDKNAKAAHDRKGGKVPLVQGSALKDKVKDAVRAKAKAAKLLGTKGSPAAASLPNNDPPASGSTGSSSPAKR
jgi:hypothetical protein